MITRSSFRRRNGRSSKGRPTCELYTHQTATPTASRMNAVHKRDSANDGGSFGQNHYGTMWTTGKRAAVATASHFGVVFGLSERVPEKDGKIIGNKGHNGHPYDSMSSFTSSSKTW